MAEMVKNLHNMTQGEIFNVIANTDPTSELVKIDRFKLRYITNEQVELDDDKGTREVEKLTLICEINGELKGFHSTSLTLNAQLKKAVIFFGEGISNQWFSINDILKGSNKQYELRTL